MLEGLTLLKPEEVGYLATFAIVFCVSLTMDIFMHRKHKEVSIANAAAWTGIWMLISIGFAGVTYLFLGEEKAWLYLSGWFLEKTLAVDNLIAFSAIFASFKLAEKQFEHLQHRILHWGIIGAIVFRVFFLCIIGFLLALPHEFHKWIMTAASLIILFTAYKMAFKEDKDVDYSKHWSVRWTRWLIPVREDLADGKFFAKKDDGKGGTRWAVTVPFLCLVCVEVVDVLFAFDSMPAIAAVCKDPVIMCTATLMAAAGLRALYFVILAAQHALCHLEKAVIALLVFIAVKVICAEWGLFHISNMWNLAIVGSFLLAGVLASFLWPEKKEEEEEKKDGEEDVETSIPNDSAPSASNQLGA